MHKTTSTDRVDLRDYLRPLWSYGWLIIVLVVVATAGTYYYYDQKPRVYTASTTLFVESSGVDSAFGVLSPRDDRNILNQSYLIRSRPVAERAARLLKLRAGGDAVLGVVSASPVTGADFIELSTSWFTPRGAAMLADAYAQAYLDIQAKELRRKARAARVEAQRQLAELKRTGQPDSAANPTGELSVRIQRLKAIEELPGASLRQVEPAVASATPISPKPKQNALFAFAISLALGILAAYALARFDRRIKDPSILERTYGVPVLADIPRTSKRELESGGVSIPEPMTEGFRRLRANVELVAPEGGRTLIVTSAVPGEGKSTIVRNLALAYHEAGNSVVVVEADLREPSLARMMGVAAEPGLTDVIEHHEPLDLTIQSVVEWPEQGSITQNGNGNGNGLIPSRARPVAGCLDVLVRGQKPRNLPAIFAQGAIDEVVRTLACRYDIVLIDSPPLGAVSDATSLLSSVDGVLLVTRLGVTTEDAAKRLAAVTERASEARILGVVVNAVKERPMADYYAYAPR